jgi:branched-chain amino acid transport system ATP-binding protein
MPAVAQGALYRPARSGLSLVTEDRTMVRRLPVGENLRLGRADLEGAFVILPELTASRNRKAGLQSGGEQEILVMARIPSSRPKLLLPDELSFGLAPLIVQRLLSAVRSSARTRNAGALRPEQHAVAALAVADRGYVLRDGQVALSGSAHEPRRAFTHKPARIRSPMSYELKDNGRASNVPES